VQLQAGWQLVQQRLQEVICCAIKGALQVEAGDVLEVARQVQLETVDLLLVCC
jgi:hypothetical protein